MTILIIKHYFILSNYLKVTQNSMNDAEFVMAKAIKSHERKLQKYGKFGY